VNKWPFVAAWGEEFRRRQPEGSPTVPVDGSDAARRVWAGFFFGAGQDVIGSGNTGQGGQTAEGAGDVSGIAGISETGQGGQTAEGAGDVSGIAGISETGQGGQTAEGTGTTTSPAKSYGLYIAHGFVSTLYRSLTKVAANGTKLWTADKGSSAFACAVDSAGNVIFGGNTSSSKNLWKFNEQGTEITDGWPIWHNDSTDTILGLAVDADDAIYVAGARSDTSSRPTAKYAGGGGSPVWSYAAGSTMRAVAVDSEGFVVFAGNENSGIALRKWTPGGSSLNSTNHGTNVDLYAVATPVTDIIAAGDYNTSDSPINNIRRYEKASPGDNFNSTAVWKREYLNARIRGVAVDSNDNIYVVGLKVASNGTLKKYNSAGALQWSADHGADMFCVALDEAQGWVYAGGARGAGSGNISVRKYDLDTGAEITAAGWPLDLGAGGTAYALALFVPPPAEIPGLPLPLELALPIGTFSVRPAALALPLALPLPAITEPPLPPLAPAKVAYALYLGAAGELRQPPLKSFECRRRRNDSTWLSVAVPGLEYAAWAASHIGAFLWIYAGDGVTMGEFLRATLTDVRYSQTGSDAETLLTARVAAVNETLQSRMLAGVERLIGADGRRSAICSVIDFRLRPGDLVTAAGETFTAYSVQYRVEPDRTLMTVRESP
jgi:hypothetical protein